MSTEDVFRDPLFRSLLASYERAVRRHHKALIELRAYHLKTLPAEIDEWRAAMLAQEAHDAVAKLQDALHALTEYGWKLTPYCKEPRHLQNIEAERCYHRRRLEGAGWRPGHRPPVGDEVRVQVDGGPQVTVVLDGAKRSPKRRDPPTMRQ